VRSHVFGTAVDWTLDDLIIGEGQRLDWFLPAEVPALPLVLPLAHLITGFLASDLYIRLAGDRRTPRLVLTNPLPPDLPAALGLDERPSIVLSSLDTENRDAALRRWRGRLAPGGLLWLLTPAGVGSENTLPGGLTALCLRPE
jgi:hypothetical protein